MSITDLDLPPDPQDTYNLYRDKNHIYVVPSSIPAERMQNAEEMDRIMLSVAVYQREGRLVVKSRFSLLGLDKAR